MEDYTPIYSKEAERAVLGACLLSVEATGTATELLNPRDFYDTMHGKLFELITEMYQAGKPVDFVTAQIAMKDKGLYETLGGQSFLAELVSTVTTTATVRYHAGIVKDRAGHRRMVDAGRAIIELANDQGKDLREVVSEAEKVILKASGDKESSAPAPLKELSPQAFSEIMSIQASGGRKTKGYSSGFRKLDEIIVGFQPGSLNIIAARPSMGKTALALNIAQFGGNQEENPCVLIFSIEMKREQLMQRMFSARAKVRLSDMMTGLLSERDVDDLKMAALDLSERNIYISDESVLSAIDFWTKCRRFKTQHPDLALIVVDYLQLMSAGRKHNDNRQEETADISRTLKAVADELNCPVIALSQLSREVEKRVAKKPQLSDLRDSGAIEQDADVVMLLYREDYYDDGQDHKLYQKQYSKAELRVAKNRNGRTGVCNLEFRREYTCFTDYVEED